MKAYNFKDLRSFHMGMGIPEESFEFFVKTILDGLKELDIKDENLLNEAREWLNRTKNDVLDL